MRIPRSLISDVTGEPAALATVVELGAPSPFAGARLFRLGPFPVGGGVYRDSEAAWADIAEIDSALATATGRPSASSSVYPSGDGYKAELLTWARSACASGIPPASTWWIWALLIGLAIYLLTRKS